MSTVGTMTIRLAGRRAIGDVVVGVLRAAMDEELGSRVAELHLARESHPGRRLEVREGQLVDVGDGALRVESIHPYTGQRPAGIVVSRVASGSAVSDDLG